MEKSFDKIHLSEAAKMLSITNINSMKEYGNKVQTVIHKIENFILIKLPLQREWSLNSGDYYLFQIDVKKCDDSLTALELAKQAIEYARELEMIV